MLMIDGQPVSEEIRLTAFQSAFSALREFALDPSQQEPFVNVLFDGQCYRLMRLSDFFSSLTDCDEVIPGLFKDGPDGTPQPQHIFANSLLLPVGGRAAQA